MMTLHTVAGVKSKKSMWDAITSGEDHKAGAADWKLEAAG